MNRNSLKSQSGITMISLIIYVASFLTVTVVIGFITTFFYNNVVTINGNLGSTSGYDAFDNCMLSEVKRPNAQIASATGAGTKYSGIGLKNDASSVINSNTVNYAFISFKYQVSQNDTTSDAYSVFLYDKAKRVLYYNRSVLCKNVDEFSARTYKDASGKEVLETFLKINDIPFKTVYVLNNY